MNKSTRTKNQEPTGKNEIETKKIKSGIKVIGELQRLFAKMQMGVAASVDPTEVLDSIVDDNGVN